MFRVYLAGLNLTMYSTSNRWKERLNRARNFDWKSFVLVDTGFRRKAIHNRRRPQNAGCYINCGYLVDWVTPGTVGHYPEDQIGAGTWFDSGTSPAVCTQVDALETAARNWPQGKTTYFVPGPNSNTFAHAMATSGNFAATQPPSATGW
jgi:hypothetical protein